jgi:transcriptional regulator with XRE-family HTH domain
MRAGISLQKLADDLEVTLATVSRWETGARSIPAERVAAISALTDAPNYILRPDIFEAPK